MFTFDSPQPLLPEIIALHGKWQNRKIALIFEDKQISWQAFADLIHQFAAALHADGLRKGDRVIVVMDNSVEMAISLFGIMAAGAVSVPINLSVTNGTLEVMIADASASAVIASRSQQPRIEAIRSELPTTVATLLTTGEASDGWQQWSVFMQHGDHSFLLPEINSDAPLNIIYSSGTTGQPKGIVHTHRGRRDWAYDLALALRYHNGSRTLITIGMYSNISWVAMLCTLVAGGTLVIHDRFDAGRALSAIEQDRITNLSMVPIQFQRMLTEQNRQPRDVSSLTAAMSCGSPLQPELKEQLLTLLSGGVIELYGLTEGIITTLQPEDADSRLSSVGKPLIGTDIKIIGEDNNEQVNGEPGEIVSRGRITMPCYLNREDATREACWQDGNGRAWLRSGDIGKLDEDGFLYIVDRKKDMILSGGQNIYPQDIEAVLIQHQQVDDVAVIPAISERWGETPIALVVAEMQTLDRQVFLEWANERLGRQQRIADVIIVDELPRNPNGKILKKDLKLQYKDLSYN